MRLPVLLACCLVLATSAAVGPSRGDAKIVEIVVDTARVLHPINPEIYGVSFATSDVLRDLNLPLDRSGGNSATLYDWRNDARNTGADYFFESVPVTDAIGDQFNHGFVAQAKSGGAKPIVTIPAIGWTARLGPARTKLPAFSQRKYGRQQASDTRWFPEAGNGKHPDGTPITVNDPSDAAREVEIAEEARSRVSDLVARWGNAAGGGVPYYAVDNEPGLWHQTHRAVQKTALHADDLATRTIAVARAIKAADPTAKVIAPEAWGWPEYFDSAFDADGKAIGRPAAQSDRAKVTDGMDQLPWLLTRWRQAGRPVDVVSVHFYPQGGEYNDGSAGSRALQLLRNRSTRALWDEHYRDTSWIGAEIGLIPRLRLWVDTHYAKGTPIAITEYNWGGENSMSGATAQADIWGIFGRLGLNMAVRWTAPKPGTPVYKVMRLIRNADGRGKGIGELALAASVPDPDALSAFAARRPDRTVTVLVVNKALATPATARVRLTGPRYGSGSALAYRLADAQTAPARPLPVRRGMLTDEMPPQSVTLYVITPHDG